MITSKLPGFVKKVLISCDTCEFLKEEWDMVHDFFGKYYQRPLKVCQKDRNIKFETEHREALIHKCDLWG